LKVIKAIIIIMCVCPWVYARSRIPFSVCVCLCVCACLSFCLSCSLFLSVSVLNSVLQTQMPSCLFNNPSLF